MGPSKASQETGIQRDGSKDNNKRKEDIATGMPTDLKNKIKKIYGKQKNSFGHR